MSKNCFNGPTVQWSNGPIYILPYAIILKLQEVILHVVVNAENVVRKGAVGVVHKSTIVFRA